jgi:CRP-like cAMP-binding protein
LRQVSLQKGATLLEPGEPIADVYFPQTGLISLLVLGKEGDAIETATVGREGAVGLHGGLGERRSFTRATAQIGGMFSTIRANRFEHIANGSVHLRDLILRYTEVLLAETQQIRPATPGIAPRRAYAAGCCNAPIVPAPANCR